MLLEEFEGSYKLHEVEVLRGVSVALENDCCQIIYVIEIIQESVAKELAGLISADKFAYFHINEDSRVFIEVVNLTVMAGGMNYLIVSRNIMAKLIESLQAVSITTKSLTRDAA